MAKVTAISWQQNSTDTQPRSFTQVGGIYGNEIKPQEYLVDSTNCSTENDSVQVNDEREPRFFRVK